MVVVHIHNKQEYDEVIKSHSGLIVVDFTASWCGPCKRIAPYLEELSNKAEYANVKFLKVDVDDVAEVASSEGIQVMPTFYFYKGTKRVSDMSGADPQKLLALIEQNK